MIFSGSADPGSAPRLGTAIRTSGPERSEIIPRTSELHRRKLQIGTSATTSHVDHFRVADNPVRLAWDSDQRAIRENITYEHTFSMYFAPDFPMAPTRLVIAQWKQHCEKAEACGDNSPVVAVRYVAVKPSHCHSKPHIPTDAPTGT